MKIQVFLFGNMAFFSPISIVDSVSTKRMSRRCVSFGRQNTELVSVAGKLLKTQQKAESRSSTVCGSADCIAEKEGARLSLKD